MAYNHFVEEETRKNIQTNLLKESVFFHENPCRQLPWFQPQEVQLGELLGEGQFGRVYEITSIQEAKGSLHKVETSSSWPSTTLIVPDESLCKDCLTGSEDHDQRVSPRSSMDVPQYGFFWNPTNSSLWTEEEEEDRMECDPDEVERQRADIIHQTLLIDGKPRYAVKLVRPDLKDRKFSLATMDMACELKLLSALHHPNVIKVHAVMGSYGHPKGFGIIMDRLEGTLQEKMLEWSRAKHRNHAMKRKSKVSLLTSLRPHIHHIPSPFSCCQNHKVLPQPCLQHSDKYDDDNLLFLDRLLAIYDVACGMKYLHSQQILFRDLKPPNVGLTLDGRYVLFDFGLAKELKMVDLVEEPDLYKATGMTGTRVFMAPEVAMFLPYGLSADVYSFAMLMWEVMAMEMVFSDMSLSTHYELVVLGKVRPRTLQRILPTEIHDMMVQCWDADRKQRPTFEAICRTLNDYLSTQDAGGGEAQGRQLSNQQHTASHSKPLAPFFGNRTLMMFSA